MRKKHFSLSAGIVAALSTFLGCGGNTDSEKISSTVSSKPTLTNKQALDDLYNAFSSFNTDEFTPFLNKITPEEYDNIAFLKTNEAIKLGQSVDINLEYKNNKEFYYAILKSNNKVIGENFILYNTNELNQNTVEVLIRCINKNSDDSIRLTGTTAGYNIFDKSWNARDSSIIFDSLKNNPFNTSQNSRYTVNFNLQKTPEGDYKLSNIRISGLALAQNSFILKKNQLGLNPLNCTLPILFANFEKSKAIFN